LSYIGFSEDTGSLTEHIGSPTEYGLRKITLSCNDGTTTTTQSVYQKVYTISGDRLFCTDQDLKQFESDILKWCPTGRASFKDVIRKSQDIIINWLAAKGYVNEDGDSYTKWDLVLLNELKEWSQYLSLGLIFEGISNAVDDVFSIKSKDYYAKSTESRSRYLSVDIDGDGKADSDEKLRTFSGEVYRR
jgi:hypothetical protein